MNNIAYFDIELIGDYTTIDNKPINIYYSFTIPSNKMDKLIKYAFKCIKTNGGKGHIRNQTLRINSFNDNRLVDSYKEIKATIVDSEEELDWYENDFES